jgi:hypothetical protein
MGVIQIMQCYGAHIDIMSVKLTFAIASLSPGMLKVFHIFYVSLVIDIFQPCKLDFYTNFFALFSY